MGVALPATALYAIAGVLLVYNFILYDLLRYSTWGGKEPSPARIGGILTFQICADLFILAAILHFSGGIENPFSFFFVFHMIIASILRSKWQSYLQATLAVVLFGGLVVLEALGWIEHYHLAGFVGRDGYESKTYVFGFVFVFTITMYLVVYMTTSISEQLRKQQQSYERANTLLQEKDQLKNEYVLRVTHDIKGHLAAVQSCLDIVFGEMVGPLNEKQKDLIERAHRRTAKCMAFVWRWSDSPCATAYLTLSPRSRTGRRRSILG